MRGAHIFSDTGFTDCMDFIDALKAFSENGPVFNPWRQTDRVNDIDCSGASVRRRQLFQYLQERVGRATCLFVGEALGYQGGHFTGIPMTSERILLGGHAPKGILPQHVFTGLEPRRTSRTEIKPAGFSEPTATIVWGHLIQAGFDTRRFILWNAFPWHPFKPDAGPLSNRTPTQEELDMGGPILMDLIERTRPGTIIAVGEKAHAALNKLGVKARKVRHPANGGAGKFRRQVSRLSNTV